jgi:hypothetical protein
LSPVHAVVQEVPAQDTPLAHAPIPPQHTFACEPLLVMAPAHEPTLPQAMSHEPGPAHVIVLPQAAMPEQETEQLPPPHAMAP